jgi:hypothetical protein
MPYIVNFKKKYISNSLFFAPVTESALDVDCQVTSILGNSTGTHGAELWLWNSDDRATILHEASTTLQPKRCKFLQITTTMATTRQKKTALMEPVLHHDL